jgi:hypothetical protein
MQKCSVPPRRCIPSVLNPTAAAPSPLARTHTSGLISSTAPFVGMPSRRLCTCSTSSTRTAANPAFHCPPHPHPQPQQPVPDPVWADSRRGWCASLGDARGTPARCLVDRSIASPLPPWMRWLNAFHCWRGLLKNSKKKNLLCSEAKYSLPLQNACLC